MPGFQLEYVPVAQLVADAQVYEQDVAELLAGWSWVKKLPYLVGAK